MLVAAIASFLLGVGVGAAGAWMLWRRLGDERVAEVRRAAADQKALWDEAKGKLSDTFAALAAQTLRDQRDDFLTVASERFAAVEREAELDLEARQTEIEGVVAPVREALLRVDQQIKEIEKERGKAYGALSAELRALGESQLRLRDETGNLVKALRAPQVRGRWGEIQLRRVVELAGMIEHCDFAQQVTAGGDDGRVRPDMIVRLPGGQSIVVDAKAPMEAYLAAAEAKDDATRTARLRDHAAQVRAHVQKLASKSYWAEFENAPEAVVLFLPGESFYGAALDQMPDLIEQASALRVLVATPTSLIALLRAAHLGWRQERVAENAQRISDHGRLLHERLATLVEHFNALGRTLGKSVEHYNAAMSSFEQRVMPAARRFEDMGAGGRKELADAERVDRRPRLLAEPPKLDA